MIGAKRDLHWRKTFTFCRPVKTPTLGRWAQSGAHVEVEPPSDVEVAQILARTLRQAKKDWGDIGQTWADDEYEVLQSQAIQAKLPLDVPKTRHRRSRVAVAEGFSLHAGTAVHADGVRLAFQFTDRSKLLRVVSFEWPPRHGRA